LVFTSDIPERENYEAVVNEELSFSQKILQLRYDVLCSSRYQSVHGTVLSKSTGWTTQITKDRGSCDVRHHSGCKLPPPPSHI